MNHKAAIFQRQYFTLREIPICFSIVVFILLEINSIFNKNIFGIIFFLVFVVLFLIIYFRIPSKIRVDASGIKVRRQLISWIDINEIIFSVDRAGAYIVVRSKNDQYIILSRHYKNKDDLRKIIEDFCIEKNIHYVIEDKGSLR